ncbi:hypothetical protein MKW98_005860 [Papaver atlanticum]|uniref:DHFR domain-containing protein n=1 Tax=Papaver atlanticum TaxID=357466 RepID=A0AAD4XUN1_9MAGN|nr:hypothetical protein MKW98_005860 [Papaver atlanticum]
MLLAVQAWLLLWNYWQHLLIVLSIEKVFVIGGGQVLREALNAPGCDAIHLTEIETNIECDTFIPPVDSALYKPWNSSFPRSLESVVKNGVTIDNNNNIDSSKSEAEKFSSLPKMIFERHEEYNYMKLVQDIISNDNTKDDRTGTGTLTKFGSQMRFNLQKSFPLLTTKTLKISSEKKDIDSFVATDFKLMDYDPRRKIEMKMAV